MPYHQQVLVCNVFFMHSLQDRLISGHACFSITDFTATLLDSIFESYKDVDGFRYMCDSSGKIFGKVNIDI
ncbi:hypothetical protein MUK42_09292 [Musa troglodytarum]|uniref:Uncharacterized protein n=1 Tax=Musa troglodytarum TaxID=320322 RepID=A0A9E7EH69_9LILI|nr:hypothetical protein MUK42_09292 [Musa troglodytarum]